MLQGCAGKLIPFASVYETPQIAPNVPQGTKLQEVNWMVLTAPDLLKMSQDPNIIIFALTPYDAQKVGENQVEQQRYILQLKEAFLFYDTKARSTVDMKNEKTSK